MAPDRFEALLADAQRGDEAAWAEIFAELAPAVLGYLRGSGIADPEDAMGETFLQVARDCAGFEGDWQKFRAWVFTVAHHRLIDARRRGARRPLELVPDAPEPDRGSAEDASTQALAALGAAEVAAVLEALSPDQRAVLLLRLVADLSLEQVAEATGKRVGAVKQLQRRGLIAARRELAKRGVTP